MSTRVVTVNLNRITGQAWPEGSKVSVRLNHEAYTAAGGGRTYPKDSVEAQTDAAGVASLELWVNAEAVDPVNYVCWLPTGERVPFVLPPGAGPISLEALRLLGAVPATPSNVEIYRQVFAVSLAALFASFRSSAVSTALAAGDFALVTDSAGDIVVVLPPAAARPIPYLVKNVGAGLVTLVPEGGEVINRAATLDVAAGDSYIVVPAAGGWETW